MSEPDNITVPWTTEHLISLAENEHHARTSRNFALPQRWLELGRAKNGHTGTVWGRFPNKDKAPIKTSFTYPDLSFTCDCTHRLFPCYHAFGLALLFAEQAEVFASSTSPAWALVAKPAQAWAKNRADEFSAKRLSDLRAGLDALELWLHDLVRNGLESVRGRDARYWNAVADRLVDARASELALEVRAWGKFNASDPQWAETLLGRMGRLHLLIDGFKRLKTLPPPVQADLQRAVGWTGTPAGDSQRDLWHVLGRRNVQAGRRKVQRIWLRGEASGRPALLTFVKQGKRRANTSLLTGLSVEAELAFFESSVPLHAELIESGRLSPALTDASAHTSIKEALAEVAQAYTRNPWVGALPLALKNVTATLSESGWFVRDAAGYVLPLPPKFAYGWQLRALSRAGDLALFGEWDGKTLTPLSVWQSGRRLDVSVLRGAK